MTLPRPRLSTRGLMPLMLVYLGAALATCGMPAPAHAQSGIYQLNPPPLANGQRGDFRLDADGSLVVSDTPSGTAAGAINPAVNSLPAGSLVAKTAAGNVYGFSITTGPTAGYVMLVNRNAVPVAGAIVMGVANGNAQFCAPVAANTNLTVNWPTPVRYSVGIALVWSSTACGTLTYDTSAIYASVIDQ